MFSGVQDETAFAKLLAAGGLLLSAITLGIFLATDSIAVFYFAIAIGWLFLVPYHSKIAVFMAIGTYGAALIIPYVPGRPFLWEFAALLGFSGLVITIFMRQFDRSIGDTIRRSPFLFLGVICYCGVLFFIMHQRGVGFRVLGSEQFGGRFYFQQLTCAIFPFLFAFCPLGERRLLHLMILQQILAATYLVSDFAFSIAPGELYFLLSFFELSGDAMNFEMQAIGMGLRRYQSLYIVGVAGIWLLLYRYKLSYLLTKGFMGPTWILIALFAVGLMSGHRYLVMISSLTVLTAAYAQRFFTPRNILTATFVGLISLFIVYGYVEQLPLTMQRAASLLPGIKVDMTAKSDAEGTWKTRQMLRQVGATMVPQYLWVGRGFGQASADYSMSWDPTTVTAHVNQGRFYNGLIGLLVNTGLAGTLAMAMFLGSGTVLAWRILRHIRTFGAEDTFSRMCSIVASLWVANLIAFVFLHGDSEYALKTFALQAGVLIACERNLLARVKEQALEEAAAAEEVEDEPAAPALPKRLAAI